MGISNTIVTRAVRQYMKENCLTQQKLAEQLDISQAKISKLLNGKSNWSLADIDLLISTGVALSISAYEIAVKR